MTDITREELISSLADLFGYSVNDWDGMNKKDIIEYVGKDRICKVEGYCENPITLLCNVNKPMTFKEYLAKNLPSNQ